MKGFIKKKNYYKDIKKKPAEFAYIYKQKILLTAYHFTI